MASSGTAPEQGSMRIQDAPHGINVVVEAEEHGRARLYIGRFDETNGFEVVMHDADVHDVAPGEDAELRIRQTATYGVAVNAKSVSFPVAAVKRVRLLGEIEKLV
jgi:hypothetical protein